MAPFNDWDFIMKICETDERQKSQSSHENGGQATHGRIDDAFPGGTNGNRQTDIIDTDDEVVLRKKKNEKNS